MKAEKACRISASQWVLHHDEQPLIDPAALRMKKKNLPSFPWERPAAVLLSQMHAVNHQVQWQIIANCYHVEQITILKYQTAERMFMYLCINISLAVADHNKA